MRSRIIYLLLITFSISFMVLSCEGPAGPEGPVGSQGEQGPEGPQGPAGEDGNANVTLYIFDGADFTSSDLVRREINDVTETEMNESKWNVYLVHSSGWIYHLSGYGISDDTMYFTAHRWVDGDPGYVDFWIEAADGPGEEYVEIHIIRTAANTVNDERSKVPAVNFSDYDSVIEHYGIEEEDTKRIFQD